MLYCVQYKVDTDILVRYCLKSHLYSSHLYSMPPRGGSLSEYCHNGTEKLEQCGYLMVKKVGEHVYSFQLNPQTKQTDRQTPHNGMMHGISQQK